MSPAETEFTAVLTGVSHDYPGEAAPSLDSVDLMFRRGERVALIGPSGAGKSTLMTLLDGRLRAWRGGAVVLTDVLDPTRPAPRALRAEVGFIFQEFALVERASVWRNVLNGRLGRAAPLASLFGRFSGEDIAATRAALADAGIEALADKRVDRLSGGQRQRVAIARCLAQEPKLILADEPVSQLDPVGAESILNLLGDAAQKRNATLIFSSHQPALAVRMADRVVALKAGAVAFDGPAKTLTKDRLAEIYEGAIVEGEDGPALKLVV